MIEYSLLECTVKAMELSAGTQLSVKNKETGAVTACGNADTTKCQYSTFATSEGPTLDTLSLDAAKETVSFTGTELMKLGTGLCEMEALGVQASSCAITSAQEGRATFDLGFPVADEPVVPTINLKGACGPELETRCINLATPVENRVTVAPVEAIEGIANPLEITNDASQTLSCGYAGGCHRTIEGRGLATSMQANRAEVKVCGRPCILDEAMSTSSEVHCEVPAIQSTGSLESFEIFPSGPILGEVIASSSALSDVAFDESNFPVAESTGSDCYIGTTFDGDASGYMVGILSEVNFFMDFFADKSVYNGKLKLQGKNALGDARGDGEELVSGAWTDILTVGAEIHEGWNYYKLQDEDVFGPSYTLPRYRQYRLYNSQSNGCDKLGELTFIGQVGFDSDADTHNCDVTVSATENDFAEESLSASGGA